MSEKNLGDFFALCDSAHREFYSVLIREWEELGLPWMWQDDMVGLGFRSATREREVVFFLLHRGFDIYPATIRLNRDLWNQWLGKEAADRIMESLERVQGLDAVVRNSELVISDPGNTSGPVQQQLRDQIKSFGFRLPELVGR